MPPVQSHCSSSTFQPVGLSYCLNSSPHLFFFNSRRAPSRTLLSLKQIITLLGPCYVVIHLESQESPFKQITIFHGLSQPIFFFSPQSFIFLSSDFQMHINFRKRTLKERHNTGLGWDRKVYRALGPYSKSSANLCSTRHCIFINSHMW